ncbi:MAG: HEAT repeat domain-containing protein [Deltaproteobacteria bacterium]|nr:HEAT repeat domain-containing protein [Deltaproteobacteria bacterium]
MRLLPIFLCAALVTLPSCKKADPNNWEDQVGILKGSNKTTKEKERACENLRKIGKKDAVPGLVEALKTANSKIKGEIAQVLGDLKDPSALAGLSDALDLSVGDGTDKMTSDANEATKYSARAIGDIGSKEAVASLIRLLKATRNNYVRIETMGALGKLKDPTAVPVLSEIALDDRVEPLISKKAIMALTSINHGDALPVYLKMSFSERKGLSFYPESSFGVFMLGEASKDRVLAMIKGEDKELMAWAKEREILVPAIFAKGAQMECDLQDSRAIDPLLKLLKYDDENIMYKLAVRMNAADALGRMRAKEAVSAIGSMLTEEEANTRGAYMRSLVQIGDKGAVAKLADCAKSGSWSAREFCALGLALLGSDKEIKVFDSLLKEEPGRFKKECNDGLYGEVDCAAEEAKNVEARAKVLGGYRKALETISACADNKCLEQALNHTDPIVRERAAYELGRRNAAESLPALFAAIKRPVADKVDLNPRFAAICAVDWVASSDPKAMTAAKAEVNALNAQIEQEKEKTLTMRIAEEVKRLSVKLERSK